MHRVKPMEKIEAPERVKTVFKEIEAAFGMIPNLFKTSAHFPPLLESNWEKVKAVMMGGSLSRKTKETIAVLVSSDNSCDYCVDAHTAALKSIGVDDSELQTIMKEMDQSNFSAKEKGLIRFPRKANKEPLAITDAEFADLRSVGATDPEIIEALGVMEVFTAFNKFLDSLSVETDF